MLDWGILDNLSLFFFIYSTTHLLMLCVGYVHYLDVFVCSVFTKQERL